MPRILARPPRIRLISPSEESVSVTATFPASRRGAWPDTGAPKPPERALDKLGVFSLSLSLSESLLGGGRKLLLVESGKATKATAGGARGRGKVGMTYGSGEARCCLFGIGGRNEARAKSASNDGGLCVEVTRAVKISHVVVWLYLGLKK